MTHRFFVCLCRFSAFSFIYMYIFFYALIGVVRWQEPMIITSFSLEKCLKVSECSVSYWMRWLRVLGKIVSISDLKITICSGNLWTSIRKVVQVIKFKFVQIFLTESTSIFNKIQSYVFVYFYRIAYFVVEYEIWAYLYLFIFIIPLISTRHIYFYRTTLILIVPIWVMRKIKFVLYLFRTLYLYSNLKIYF